MTTVWPHEEGKLVRRVRIYILGRRAMCVQLMSVKYQSSEEEARSA